MNDSAYYLYRIAGAIVPLVPARVGYAVADWLGRAMASATPSQRAAVRGNLRHVMGPELPERQLDWLARRTFSYMAKNYFDLFRVPRLSLQRIESLVAVSGRENLTAAMAAGKGAILAAAHYGNVDVAMQRVATLPVPLSGPAEHLRPEKLYQYLVRVRGTRGVRFYPSDGVLTELFRALRRNELVGLAVDRDTTDSGRVATFFGAPAKLPDGAVQLSLRTGAPILFAYALRTRENTFHVRMEPPIWLQATRDREADIAAGMQSVLAVVERCLQEDPLNG